jgi:hypothetical protein
VYGPVGEGIYPMSGIGSDEVFELEATPGTSVTPASTSYKDGTSSTFGARNLWSSGTVLQDFSALRSAAMVTEPASRVAHARGHW